MGVDASAVPLRNRQVLFVWTSSVIVSSKTLHVAPGPSALNTLEGPLLSLMPWSARHEKEDDRARFGSAMGNSCRERIYRRLRLEQRGKGESTEAAEGIPDEFAASPREANVTIIPHTKTRSG